jgi:hypothetical protein
VSRKPSVTAHDDEAEPGLPAPLPAGERLIWRGAPDWRVLARRGFHLPWFALYFGVLVAWRALATVVDGGSVGAAAATLLWTLPLAVLALSFVVVLASLVARTAVYTITDRRIVLRIGIVLTVTFNLPLRRIETARLHALPGGAGDIALVLHPEDRIGYLHLWPHARPWRFTRTEPMLRALPQAGVVAGLLADALAQSAAAARASADQRAPAAAAAAADHRQRPAAGTQAQQPLANAA